jgi:hypothetical protein
MRARVVNPLRPFARGAEKMARLRALRLRLKKLTARDKPKRIKLSLPPKPLTHRTATRKLAISKIETSLKDDLSLHHSTALRL